MTPARDTEHYQPMIRVELALLFVPCGLREESAAARATRLALFQATKALGRRMPRGTCHSGHPVFISGGEADRSRARRRILQRCG